MMSMKISTWSREPCGPVILRLTPKTAALVGGTLAVWSMTPLACRTCGREVAPIRFRAEHLRPHGWRPPQTLHIPDWYGCTTEYVPVPDGQGWWDMVPIWDPT